MHGRECIKPRVKPRACRRSKSQDLVIGDYRKSSADRDLGSQSKDKVISRIRQLKRGVHRIKTNDLKMPALLAAFVAIAAFAFVLTTNVKSSATYTTQIGSRTPPVEEGFMQTSEFRTEHEKLLKIYRCPT